jgi:hypothetical protein
MLGFAVLASLLIAVPAHATPTPVDISDGTFAAAQWSSAKCYGTSAQTYSVSQSTTGGNPGDYRLVSESTTSGGPENVTNVFSGASYDPVTQGAITSIDWSFDAKLITKTGSAGFGAWFILEQGVDSNHNPVIFQSNNLGAEKGEAVITSTTAWTTFAEQLMTASSWTSNQSVNPGAPLNPDFSATAAVITFGFETSSDPGSGTNTYAAGFDNWYADVNHLDPPAPEPVTMSLLAIGGLALLRRRNK